MTSVQFIAAVTVLFVGAEFCFILYTVNLSRFQGFTTEWWMLFWSIFLIPGISLMSLRKLRKTTTRLRAGILGALIGPILALLHLLNLIGMINAWQYAEGNEMQSEGSQFVLFFLGPPALIVGILIGIPLSVALWYGSHATIESHSRAL